jgi:prepilin-type N-terminal cleavage/methylation domain-containing protein
MMNTSSGDRSRVSRLASRRCGFTLIELLVVIAIIALLVAILLPALGEAKKSAKLALNFANLKQFGTASQSYAAEFKEAQYSFTWRRGINYGPRPGAAPVAYTSTDDVQAAAQQAVDTIRRRAQPEWPQFPMQDAWIPHVFYTHLVLMDYLQARLPEPMIRSPFDRLRAQWAEALYDNPANPASVIARFNLPRERWPYSSSYETVPASYTPNRWTSDGGSLQNAGGQYGLYQYNPGGQLRYRLGFRKLSEVAFPAAKVLLHESVMRHLGKKELYFTHPQAVVTIVAFDASVRTLAVRDCNQGGHQTASGAGIRAPITYVQNGAPEVSLPPWTIGTPLSQPARFRWTVGGLSGIDFGQTEPIRVN